MTVAEARNVSQRSVSYRDAEIFLQEVLGCDMAWLHAHGEEVITSDQERRFEAMLARRETNEPVAYIIGRKEFYGRPFAVDKRVLIPRPETEAMIDRVLEWAPGYFKMHTEASNRPCPVRILEIGTGSGNIAVTLALELAKLGVPAKLIATDVSAEALDVARANWEALKAEDASGLAHAAFVEADMFAHEIVSKFASYPLIIANLPYVADGWKFDEAAQPDVVFYEPAVALFGGEDGLDHYRTFFGEVERYLAPDGRILIEYGEDESVGLTSLAAAALPHRERIIYKDYAGLDRVMEII